ncbi:MAG: site-specific DNA-methyltransferase, partial [Eubacteriales bacterium]|nr:site-specific DNA-methyltransferase [Eubacteriales bacterium]
KMKMESPDMTAQNIDRIAALFPNCVTEAADGHGGVKRAVNFELLKQMLSPDVVEGDECYEFTWVGKKAAIVEANKPIRKTLRPCVEESKDWDTTENLYIEGDNLEVLKLLQESYLGKVKMIYIDPPYNTGNDFIYADDFMRSQEEENEQMGMYDEDENRLFKNTDTNGRFHSDWCSMIYSRLMLARNLLTEDGVIFISIDDNEVKDLMPICDEVFGSFNFLATFTWQKKYGPANDAKGVSATHEYILLYGKNSNQWVPGLLPRNDEQLKAYKNPDNDPRGVWRASALSARTYSASCDYIITGPTGLKFSPPPSRSWIVNEESYQRMLADNRITFGADGTGRPMQKKFITEVKDGITPETWLPREKGGDNKIARYELKEIFPENLFDTPKPSKLIKYLETIAGTKDTDIILDFFSGSATTAHAVMQLNAEDGGHRKFIMVQLPEKCDEASEAYKAGYKNICEIGKERIRRAGEKIKSESPMTTQDLDIGFRVLKLDDTNMKDVYYAPDDYDQGMLAGLESNIKDERTDLDLLFGCLIDWGLPLSLPYSSEQLGGCTVHTYNDGDLIACFDANIPESVVKEIAKRKPLRAVFRDSGFASSPEKINVFEIFKLYMPEDANDITKRVRVL